MKSALEARDGSPRSTAPAPLGSRYSIVGRLHGSGQAKLFVALPRFAWSVEQVVVITAYDSAEDAGGADVRAQLEVASAPHHENLVRVLECSWDVGRQFIVSEYLEGTTLRRLLQWLDARGQKLPDAASARILIGMLAAIEHAADWALTPQARALVRQPIQATDVCITPAGGVKVLGFEPPARGAASAGPPAQLAPAAVDDLLSKHQSPALSAVLARIGKLSSSASLIGLPHILRILKDWQWHELGSDGGAELAKVMTGVQPEERAARRMQLEAAIALVLRAREAGRASK